MLSSRAPSVSGHPPSTPPDVSKDFPPELVAHLARLVNSNRIQTVNLLTKQHSQLEKGVKDIVSEYLKKHPDGGDAGAADHSKCVEENGKLKLELEEKNQRIKELEEKLENASNNANSERLESVSSRTIGTPQPPAPAAPAVQDSDIQVDNKALRQEVIEIAASNTKMKAMLNKQIDELHKKLQKEKERSEGYRRKTDNETVQRREFEKQFNTMKKQLEMIIFCLNKSYDRYEREGKKWSEWAEGYGHVQSRVFGLIDAVRAGDLWDLELNSLEEMLKQSPPPGIDLRELQNILKNFGHVKKSRKKAVSDKILHETGPTIKNEPEDEENPTIIAATTNPTTTVEDTRPPSPIIPEEEAETAGNGYDSDATTTDGEGEAILDHFSPLARAMARGPGPETMQALFPADPSSPIPCTARSRLHEPAGLDAGEALPPAPPTPIKLESDSSVHSPDEHTRLGYYRFDRDGGDTLDVDEHGRPLELSEPVMPSSPTRPIPTEHDTNPQSILREEDVEQSNEMQNDTPRGPVREREEEDDVPSDTDGRADPEPSGIGNLMSKLKYRQFGEPIVNSVRVDGTHIKQEPDTTPKASKILACPNTAPQLMTKVATTEEHTPPSAKRKRTAKAQTTTKKRKIIRDADIDSVAEDGAYAVISQPKQPKKKGGQLARLLEDTPEASQGLVSTPPKSTTKAAVVSKKADPTTPRRNKKAVNQASSSPGENDEISPSRFRLNPDKNNGVAYAYHEGARKRAEKDCLPHCQKECCSGFANGKMLELFPMPKPINQPPPFRSPSKQKSPKNKHHQQQNKPITYSKKGNHISARKLEWEVNAEMREMNSKYIKHRSAHRRAEEPLGFFDADFPTTQQLEAQREESDRRRREQGWERERESRRGGMWQRK